MSQPLPQNLDAERSVLGAILIRNTVLDLVLDTLSAEHFFRDAHKRIYAAMLGLHGRGVSLDFVTVGDALKQAGELDAVGGMAYVASLTDGLPAAVNVQYYAGIVKRTATARQLIDLAADLQRQAYDDDADTASLIEAAERALVEVSARAVPGDLTSSTDLATGILGTLDRLFTDRQPLTGVETGISQLDRYTRGLQPGALIVVAGRPGSGKSSIALQVALEVAQTGPVAFFSVEMGQQEQTFRALSVLGQVDGHRLQSGHIAPHEQQRIGRALDDFGNRHFYLDDSGSISVMQIRSRCRRLKARHGLKLVIVDYLQLLQHGRSESREQAVAATTRALKLVARELDVPVIVLSQLSRKSEERTGKRPQLSDLRESGAIEQDSDVVLLIYRPDPVTNGMTSEQGPTELIIAKQRSGPTASIELAWLGEQFRFAELARDVA